MNDSPYMLTTKLQLQVNSVLQAMDVFALNAAPRKVVTDLERRLQDVVLEVRAYELSETRADQLDSANAAHKMLQRIRADILKASEYDIFSAIDVAQLTAAIDHITAQLK